MVLLKSKDGFSLFKDHDGIMKDWTEHFTDLFYTPSIINENIINNLFQKDIILGMMGYVTIDGV